MTYTILGADGREYGPVGESDVRKWIHEGRAVADTKVKATDSVDWVALSTLPAFQGMFPSPSTTAPIPPNVTSERIKTLAEEIRTQDYEIKIGDCISRGWTLYKANFGPMLGAFLLFGVLSGVIGIIPIVGQVGSILVGGPLYAGLFLYFLKHVRGQDPTISAIFDGFRGPVWALVLGYLVMGILIILGLVCLIVPGIYLAIGWMFAMPIIIDKRTDFWPAMQASKRILNRHWWKMFGFSIVAALVSMSGLLLLGVGVILTIPIGLAATAVLYEDLVGRRR